MKKFLALIFAVLMVLTACSKVPEEPEIPESSSEPSTESSSLPEEPEEPEKPAEPEIIAPEHLAYLREDFPKIDGSTSLIPLEAGIRSVIFGKTTESAYQDVGHTKTWRAFERLVEGTVDLVLTCDMSQEQLKIAEDAGMKIESVPLAYEGFVFVVNVNNPVDELTQEQLRKIYSGEITNWKEVGGNDAEIVAYQRNADSGSQNYMNEFMGDVPLMEAETYLRVGSMGGLIDEVAINDYAENSIGYSVYAYAAEMYGIGDGVKFIKVDGIAPDKETIVTKEYPLLGYNYAVFDSAEPEDSNVRKLVEWMTSEEGQLAIAKAGYVAVSDIDYDYSAPAFEKFEAVGTGTKKPEKTPGYVWTLSGGRDYEYRPEYIPLEIGTHSDGTRTYKLEFLTNRALEDEINAFILENVKKLEAEYDEYQEAIGEYIEGLTYWYYNAYTEGQKTAVIVKMQNGYLSVAVTLPYIYPFQDGADLFYDTEIGYWDIISGKRLSMEELFYSGTDIDEILNKSVNVACVSQGMTEFNFLHDMKTDFAGLTTEGDWHIDFDRIYFDYGNRYFYDSPGFEIYDVQRHMVINIPRDITGYVEGKNEPARFFTEAKNVSVQKILPEENEYTTLYGNLRYCLINEEIYPNAKKINGKFEKFISENYSRKTVAEFFEKDNPTSEELAWVFDVGDWWLSIIGERYAVFSSNQYNIERRANEYGSYYTNIAYDQKSCLIFDLETGKEISFLDMLSEKGKEKAKQYLSKIDPPGGIYVHRKNGIEINDTNNYDSVYFGEDEVIWN